MVKEVIVSGKLEVNDVVGFMFYHNYSHIGGALTGIFGVVALILSPWRFWVGDWTIGTVLLLVGLMYAVMTPLYFYSRARRQIKTNPVYKNKMTFRFNGDMLRVQLYTGAMEILWQDVYWTRFLKKQILIYTEVDQAFIVPTKYFACEDDIALLEDFAKRNHLDIPKKRRLEVEIHDDDVRDKQPE